MVTQLQPDVRAHLHGGEVIKRYIRVEEVAHEYGFSVEETEYIAKAASSLYKLTRIHLVKKERFDEFMKHIYKVPGTNKQIIKKFARIGEASIIYSIGRHRFIELAIGNIKAQMTDFERVADEAEQTEEVIPADPDVRNYTYTFFEGKLYYRENSEMVKKEVSQTAEERIRSLDEIRQITRELIDIQMDGCSEEELSDKQKLLNVKYDAFVKQYGAITSKANRIAFRDDSDYPLLCSLEEVNEDGEVKKADMF